MKLSIILLCVTLAVCQLSATPVAPREITDDDINLPDHITPEMLECIQLVLAGSHEQNPEIAWWFADAGLVLIELVTDYNNCSNLITNAAQTACRTTVTARAVVQLNRLRNTINENMENGHLWFDNLRSEWQTCLAE